MISKLARVTTLTRSVTRGQLQQLQKDASVFCGMTVVFCRKLNWSTLASCLEDFQTRLSFGAQMVFSGKIFLFY